MAEGFQPVPGTGVADARTERVMRAIAREFDGEPLFNVVVVIESDEEDRVAIAAGTESPFDAYRLVRMGEGAIRGGIRAGAAPAPAPCPLCAGEKRVTHPRGHKVRCPECRGSGLMDMSG